METSITGTNRSQANVLQRAWTVVRADWPAYIVLNIVYYGLVALGMVYVAFINPGLQQSLLDSIGQAFTSGPLSAVGSAYTGGQVINAMVLTFVVNLLLGTVAEISLPSLIIPFIGLLMGVVRAILWGLLLSPSHASLTMAMIPHSLTLLLEGQGYILGMLGVFVHGKALLNPRAYRIEGHGHGYLEGLRRMGWIYVLVITVLAVAAIYEALEVILIVPLLS